MGISLEPKKSSKQNNSLNPTDRVAKHQDKSTLQNHFDPLYSCNLRRELTKDAARSSGIHYQKSNKYNTIGDGELVKHMTNLPGYLKGVEKAKKFPDQILNVGVLDWSRLEQWKHKQKNVPDKDSSSASSSSNSKSLPKRGTGSSRSSSSIRTSRHSEQDSSLRPRLIPPHKDEHVQNVERSIKTVVRSQDISTPSNHVVPEQKGVSGSLNSFSRNHTGFVGREMMKGTDQDLIVATGRTSAEFKSYSASFLPKYDSCSRHRGTKKHMEVSREADIKRENVNLKIFSRMEFTTSKFGVCDAPPCLMEEKIAKSVRTQSRVPGLKKSNISIANQCFPEQGNRIVLLLPRDSPETGPSKVSQISQHRPSLDKTMTASRKCSFSDDSYTNDITSDTLFSETPDSTRKPSSVDTNEVSDTMTNGLAIHRRTELPSTSSHVPCSEKKLDLHSERGCVVNGRSDNKARKSSIKEQVEIPSQEHAELTGSNNRNPSPLRRFSLSLGRMGRSFSFKDTAVPQLSTTYVSVKSGAVSCDASKCVDAPNGEKAKGHSRARSSPLRRLLDPILKPKEANPAPHHSEYRFTPKMSFNSFSSGPVYSFPNEKIQESRVQALLQLKVNNGIPLFKFVVNNNSNILAATMKSLGSSDKGDSGRSYTFYLVNEIKRKSGGWISQGSRDKNCGYAYNVVGQMKVSTSEFSNATEPDSNHYFARESVLFGVERKQADQGSPEFTPNRELAAAVVKIPRKYLSENEHQTEDDSMDKWLSPESRCSNCVSVILPGGVHGIPNKGEPSSLTYRWTSGSCDCGGWDIGCKLQVLSNQNNFAKVSKALKDDQILDSFELFHQDLEQNGSIFSLVPSNDGIYSVEYNTSISRLQAFFICVVMLSGQKVPHLPSAGNISESKPFDQADVLPNRGLQAKFPTKYASIPPLSPVGRV